ncbi:hypothetical protein [Pseudochryseolinea flava]|uniref:Uncharacterized protein n=1 Tax=Pseudochryseolinea flava TaxID=2059302 RepID=A0A364XZ52_9BACT|nr:hypothetical protein [Pseudochryseolinea flava]RAV99269.1 hypothetical protein DQQ10_20470 [Pseudochryseolinea flava]
MKRIILYVIIFLSCNASFAQDSIEYTFDKELDRAIRLHLEKQLASDQSSKFFLRMSTVNSEKRCGNYQLFIGTYKDRPLDFIFEIISKSTRFYSFNSMRIPICFDYDFQFIGYGSGKRGITRKGYTGTDYVIEFSSSGKIIRTGI